MAEKNSAENKKPKLNIRQQLFVQKYIETHNAVQAYNFAGYVSSTMGSCKTKASQLLSRPNIRAEISRITQEQFQKNIASAEEVMDFFSRVMRGEVKDQFGLETSVADRVKAAQELAKRTIDIENRAKGLGEPVIEIKLDWTPSNLQLVEENSDTSTYFTDAEFEVVDGEK